MTAHKVFGAVAGSIHRNRVKKLGNFSLANKEKKFVLCWLIPVLALL
jgi:hypothetical protein